MIVHRLAWRTVDPGGESALLVADLRRHLGLSDDADVSALDGIARSATSELEARSGLSLCRRSITSTATGPADGSDWLPDAPCDISLPAAPVASLTSLQLDGTDVPHVVRGVGEPGPVFDARPVVRVQSWPSSPGAELVAVMDVGWQAADPGDTDADPLTPDVVMPDAAAVPDLARSWLLMRSADRWTLRSGIATDVRLARTFEPDRLLRQLRAWR